jgi:hypothetical protein
MPPFTAARVLILIALVIEVLAAFSVSFGGVALIPLGLAVYFASHLVP